MRDKVSDVLKSFGLTQAQAKEYETVKGKFSSHFIRGGITFSREQNSISLNSNLVRLVTVLLPNCMPWKNIVNNQRPLSGRALLDATLSEKLQLDPDLTWKRP